MTDRGFSGRFTIAASDYNKEKNYWLEKLSGDLEKTCFPQDYSKAGPAGIGMETVRERFAGEVFTRLMKLSRTSDYILHMILLAGVVVLLHKYTGSKDVVVGVPIYKQEKDGDFLNTVLPLRIHPQYRASFKDLLIQVKQAALEANENQNYPIETLLFQLNIPFSQSEDEFPLFDVAVLLENIHDKKYLRHTRPNIIFSFLRTGESIESVVEYNALRHAGHTMERICAHFKRLLEEAVFNVDIPVSEIDILSEEEKKQILYDFAGMNRGAEYPAEKTIRQLFDEQAEKNPDRTAAVHGRRSVTYKNLKERSYRLACVLKEKGVRPDGIVGIMMERSVEMITGIIGILKAGGAYLPIGPDYPADRVDFMLKDSNAAIVLNFEFVSNLRKGDRQIKSPLERGAPKGRGVSLAYVIYTSGTTGKPKGSLIEHRNVVRLMFHDSYLFDFNSSDVWTMFHSYCFDFSVWEMYGALLYGGKLVLIPEMTAMDPRQYLGILKEEKVTVLNQTPAAFYNLAHLELMAPGKKLKLKYVIFGGEALQPVKLKEWKKRYPETTLINMFGITETTVHVTYKRLEDKEIDLNISNIGRAIPTLSTYVLDKALKPVPIGVAGELCVGGAGVCRGYLNHPELTTEKFCFNKKFFGGSRGAIFQKSPPGRRRQKIYKSGDLARYLINGDLEYLGRIDHQVKIRGYRIELGEIENLLSRHPGVEEAVVLAGEASINPEDSYLCAYIVPGITGVSASLREFLSRWLPGYMIPAYFMEIEKIPLTANNKIDRKALPPPEAGSSGAAYAAPGNPLEETFAGIWSEVLKIEKGKVGIDSDFFELGGHSLKATILISKLHQAFNVKIPLAELFKTPTIRELAGYVKGLSEDRFFTIEVVEKKEYYPLSSAQKRLYVLQQMELAGTGYNIPQAFVLEGDLDKEMLGKTFEKLIRRHESLRTSFKLINGEPVQVITENAAFAVEYYSTHSPRDIVNHFVRAFDLSAAPLLRVGLIKINDKEHILVIDMHHIITDGTSMDLFAREFMVLYGGKELPASRLRYKDYTQWQGSEKQKEAVEHQEEYWLKQFEGEIPVLDLPLDYERPAVQSFAGNTVSFELDAAQTGALNRLALEKGATLYMVLLGIYTILLSKISGQEDIVIGTPIEARRHVDLGRIIGMFVNTLVMRNFPRKEKTFNGFLKEIKKRTLGAFENQEYPFEDLVEQVAVNRDAGRNPLFDAALALPNMEAQTGGGATVKIPGLRIKPYENEKRTAKFDLSLFAIERERLFFVFEYCTKLFKEETIERFAGYFKRILSAVLKDDEKKISRIEIISEAEKKRVLYGFNETSTNYPKNKSIPGLFGEQVKKTADRTAVILADRHITYRRLNREANRLARLLTGEGVRPDTIVGIMMERSVEMIIGIFGILKAGGAYLPIDPDYPRERIDFMLKDSNAAIVLNFEHLNFEFRASNLRKGDRQIKSPLERGVPKGRGVSLAYIIYTSGTTGKPKGTLTTHYNALRVVKNTNYIDLTGGDRVLQLSNYAFDGSVFDIYGALLNGAALVMMKRRVLLAVDRLSRLITREAVTVFFVTTALFNLLIDMHTGCFDNIRKVLFGGERVSLEHARKALRYLGKNKIIHVYGPTETTVYASYHDINHIAEDAVTIPIGKPTANTVIYILDKGMKPVPAGIYGGVYIGGDGVARGYLNQPELSVEKFIKLSKSFCGGPGGSFYKKSPLAAGGKIYKTGDLARRLPDGDIEFLGRGDNQVKIRGFRVELEEIGHRLLKHPGITDAVVVVKNAGTAGDKYLAAYFVAGKDLPVSALREYLLQYLPGYMVPSYFMQIDAVPLTINGKVDRRALPGPEAADTPGKYTAPRDAMEEKLAAIWLGVLGKDTLHRPIGIDDNFFHLSGHSLKATILTARIHKELNVKLPLTKIFHTPTIRELSAYIRGKAEDRFEAVAAVEKKDYYALSPAQKRLYILQRLSPTAVNYNVPVLAFLEGKTDRGKLEKAFEKLIQRHESFRTSFKMVDGLSVQGIHNNVEFVIQYYDAGATRTPGRRGNPADHFVRRFIRPFDLAHAPLLRVGLVKENEKKHLLMVDMHHIVTDGTSMQLLVKEFMALYRGEQLPKLRIQYKDFSGWQNRLFKSEEIKEQEKYWLKEFEGEIPLLDLPLDYERPAVRSIEGSIVRFETGVEEAAALKKLALDEGVTLYMIFLALYNILLWKISGQEDIVIGTSVAGRGHTDLEPVIGMFINTLAPRNKPVGEKTFKAFLAGVREKTLGAFKNQDYPFEDLVEKVAPDRDASRNPLFDARFSYHNEADVRDAPEIRVPGLKLTPYRHENLTAKCDLTLYGTEMEDRFSLSFEYGTKLFKEATIQRFVTYFNEVLAHVIKDKNIRLKDIGISHDLLSVKPNISQSDLEF